MPSKLGKLKIKKSTKDKKGEKDKGAAPEEHVPTVIPSFPDQEEVGGGRTFDIKPGECGRPQ